MELKNKLKSTHTVLSDARKKKTFYTLRLGHFGNFHLDFVVELKLKNYKAVQIKLELIPGEEVYGAVFPRASDWLADCLDLSTNGVLTSGYI